MLKSRLLFVSFAVLFFSVVCGVGITLVLLPSYEHLSDRIVDVIHNEPAVLVQIGISLLMLSLIVLISLVWANRRRYIYVKMGKDLLSIDKKAIITYLTKYWKALLPSHDITTNVIVHRKYIEIICSFSVLPSNDMDSFLEETERDLVSGLSRTFQYDKPFRFSCSVPE